MPTLKIIGDSGTDLDSPKSEGRSFFHERPSDNQVLSVLVSEVRDNCLQASIDAKRGTTTSLTCEEIYFLVRTGGSFERCCLVNISLDKSGIDDFSDINFKNARIIKVDFTGKILNNVDFSGSYIESSIFINANLSRAKFIDVEFKSVSFNSANLSGTNFTGIKGKLCLSRVKISDIRFDHEPVEAQLANESIQIDHVGSKTYWCRAFEPLLMPEIKEASKNRLSIKVRNNGLPEIVTLEFMVRFDYDGMRIAFIPLKNVELNGDQILHKKAIYVLAGDPDPPGLHYFLWQHFASKQNLISVGQYVDTVVDLADTAFTDPILFELIRPLDASRPLYHNFDTYFDLKQSICEEYVFSGGQFVLKKS